MPQDSSRCLEVADDLLVGILDHHAGVVRDRVAELTVLVDRVDGLDTVLTAEVEIVLAESGRRVDDARPAVGRHERGRQDAERALGGTLREEREERFVAVPGKFRALDRADAPDSLVVGPVRRDPFGVEHELLARGRFAGIVDFLDDGVVGLGVHGQRHVRRQRPGRGRPREQSQAVVSREFHGDRRVLHLFVVEVRLEVRERRADPPGVGHDPVALVDQVAFPQRLEDAPDALHEGEVHRLVVVVEIDPASEARDHIAPFVGIAQNDRSARFVEAVDAVVLDLVATVEAELLFDLELDRQPVAVPAEAPLDAAAAHRLVARHDVLDVPASRCP